MRIAGTLFLVMVATREALIDAQHGKQLLGQIVGVLTQQSWMPMHYDVPKTHCNHCDSIKSLPNREVLTDAMHQQLLALGS